MSLFCLCVYLASSYRTEVTEQSKRGWERDWAVYVKDEKETKEKER